MAPDDGTRTGALLDPTPTDPIAPIELLDPDEDDDEPAGRRSPRVRAVLALGVVLLGAAAPTLAAAAVPDPAGTRAVGVTGTEGLPPARGARCAEAITDIWGRDA